MKEDYVSFELAKKLKEKGFQERSIAYYDNFGVFRFNECTCMSDDCIIDIAGLMWCHNNKTGGTYIDAPTIAQVLKWLREKQIMVEIPISLMDDGVWCFGFRIQTKDFYERSINCDYESWEQAALACIKYVLDKII